MKRLKKINGKILRDCVEFVSVDTGGENKKTESETVPPSASVTCTVVIGYMGVQDEIQIPFLKQI